MVNKLSPISWEAEEYIHKEHNHWWYLGLVFITAAFSLLAVLIKAWTFLALIILAAITILIYSIRAPRRIHYTLDERGLTEETKLYEYQNFRAFGIVKENNIYSIVLLPKKRFGISVRAYFPSESGEAIVDNLGARLPMEEVKEDILDKIVKILRI